MGETEQAVCDPGEQSRGSLCFQLAGFCLCHTLFCVCVLTSEAWGVGCILHAVFKVMLTAVTYSLCVSVFLCPQPWFRWTEARSDYSCATLRDRWVVFALRRMLHDRSAETFHYIHIAVSVAWLRGCRRHLVSRSDFLCKLSFLHNCWKEWQGISCRTFMIPRGWSLLTLLMLWVFTEWQCKAHVYGCWTDCHVIRFKWQQFSRFTVIWNLMNYHNLLIYGIIIYSSQIWPFKKTSLRGPPYMLILEMYYIYLS